LNWLKDPVAQQHFHGWATVFFVVLTPVSWALGWFSLVEYVSALSLWALVASHWAAWAASRVEVKQDKQREE
jgi:hypothetical protein